MVITQDGILKGKAIRRTGRAVEEYVALVGKEQTQARRTLKILAGTPMVPRPVQAQHEGPEDPDERDVLEYAQKHGDGSEDEEEKPGDFRPGPSTPELFDMRPLPWEVDGGDAGMQSLKTPELPAQAAQPTTPLEIPGRREGEEMLDDAKSQKLSPGTSPTRGLYPPTFAGNALAVEEMAVDDFWLGREPL